MLLYPESLESKLGFDKIKEMLIENCASTAGVDQVHKITATHDAPTIRQWLQETAEQKQQLQLGEAFPELKVFPLGDALDHAQIEGYQLDSEYLYQVKINLELARQCVHYHNKRSDDFPIWSGLSKALDLLPNLIKSLQTVFDDHGEIKDGASQELRRLRKKIVQAESKVRKGLESILRQARSQGYTDQESALTLRDGRLVIPMQAEHKRRIAGVVVDESATGKTVYLEPMEVFNLNNEIRELQFAERREINRILLELTREVAPQVSQIRSSQQYLGYLDFTRAKAKLAQLLDAILPEIDPSGQIKLKEARHPLLQLAHQKQNLPVVPLNLVLDPDTRVVVISGPNAGGKSVCLKTVGLLQMMGQSGLLIPAQEGSVMGCFQKILVDIGDQQSIENDLSTYSSHLRNMSFFVEETDSQTLFLIDEFGAGTEPQFGGPIAEAILDQLVRNKAFGIVTTHYSNLKEFAESTVGVDNAAMRFDLEKLEPLYQLELGRPGSSFALEIAAKTGLPADILRQAKENIGEDPVAFEKLVNELEQAKQQHLRELQQLQKQRISLGEKQREFEQSSTSLQQQQKELLNQAKQQAQDLLSQANQKIESTIRSIKESKADKQVTDRVRKDLKQFKEKHKPTKPPAKPRIITGPVQIGDLVLIDGTGAQGEVIDISGKWAQVRLGDLKSKIKLERLQRIGRAPSETSKSSNLGLYRKKADFSSEIDVRGLRAGEAMKKVTDFVDEGSMLGLKDLRIIHGRGDGILRQLIRKYLLGEPSVAHITDETSERGGDGVTLITLK